MTLLLTKEELELIKQTKKMLRVAETRIRIETIRTDHDVDTFYYGRLAEATYGAQRGLDNLLAAQDGYFNKRPTAKESVFDG